MNIMGEKKSHNDMGEALVEVTQRAYTISTLGDFKYLTQKGPEQHDLMRKLVQL